MVMCGVMLLDEAQKAAIAESMARVMVAALETGSAAAGAAARKEIRALNEGIPETQCVRYRASRLVAKEWLKHIADAC